MSCANGKEDTDEDYINFAHLCAAIGDSRGEACLKKILRRGINVNYKVPTADTHDEDRIHCDTTALHYACGTMGSDEKIKLLLRAGADVTIANDKGMTVLHCALREDLCLGEEAINLILSAQVASGNTLNPRDNDGISHFHVACMTNHTEAAEFFLANGEAIDQRVDENAKFFAGYGPLHIAVRANALHVAELLLKRGASVRLKDAEGLSPLRLCLAENVKSNERKEGDRTEDVAAGKKMMKLLVESCIDSDLGLSTFHLACALGDTDLIEPHLKQVGNLNCAVGNDAPAFPGYTALHFAATSSAKTVVHLLERGADIDARDASGMSPFDICLKKYSIGDICFVMESHEALRKILLSDGKTKIVDLVSATRDLESFKGFFKNIDFENLTVPNDSPLWPGFTILHVAVALAQSARGTDEVPEISDEDEINSTDVRASAEFEFWTSDISDNEDVNGDNKREVDHLEIIKECLRLGADVTAQDARGSTPLHLAFYFKKIEVVELLLQHHSSVTNPVDKHNLSHLHIACAVGNANAVKKLITKGAEIEAPTSRTFEWLKLRKYRAGFDPFFVVTGSTALHVAVASESQAVISLLLDHGADVHAIDANGMTPIHRYLTTRDRPREIGTMLMRTRDLKNSVVEEVGLSHLHVACHLGDTEAIERLLDRGADVNATVTIGDADLDRHFLLDPYGDPSLETPYAFLHDYRDFTPLRFAAMRRRFESARLLLRRGADLHRSGLMLDALDEDRHEITPLALLVVASLKADANSRDIARTKLGMTTLHAACRVRDVRLVGDFFDAGEDDVNARIHEDSPIFPGCTALHVLMSDQLRDEEKMLGDWIFRRLMDNGADVGMLDAGNDTAMHRYHGRCQNHPAWINAMLDRYDDFGNNAIGSDGTSLLHIACFEKSALAVEQFLKHGADPNLTVDYLAAYGGYTPLHSALHDDDCEFMGMFDRTNDDEGNGRIRDAIVDLLLNYGASVNAKDRRGDTPLHLVARRKALSRHGLIRKLVDTGADVDAINIEGKTPLHLAVNSNNEAAASALLSAGADINILDVDDKTAYVHAVDSHSESQLIFSFELHILKLQLTGLFIRELNNVARNRLPNRPFYCELLRCEMESIVEAAKNSKIGLSSVTIGDVLSETGVVAAYPSMLPRERDFFDDFFENVDRNPLLEQFDEIKCLIKLQRGQALKRLSLIDAAKESMATLFEFCLPDVCSRTVLRYLSNEELKNLIASNQINTYASF